MTNSRTPIALFAYNRPQHLQQALKSLARCERLDSCELHIFSDGAKNTEQNVAVEAVRHVAREWAIRLHGSVIERPQNLGLARSIRTGVTDLSERFGRVIVVEDDLIVSPDFLRYMLDALDRYQDTPQVYQISGYMFPIVNPPAPDAFFLPLPTTWGWATWERVWRTVEWDLRDAREQLTDPVVRCRFNLDDNYPYAEMLEQSLAGKNDSWGIAFWWMVFKTHALVLHPRQSLVWNGGLEGSGAHGGRDRNLSADLDGLMQARLSYPLVFPNGLVSDQEAFERIKVFHRARKRRISTLGHRAKRMILQRLGTNR